MEFKDYKLKDQVSIGPYIYIVRGKGGEYWLSKEEEGNDIIFKYLKVEKSSYVKNILGYKSSGDFPETKTLEDLNKVIRQLQIDCLLKEAKEKYPVGIIFKSIFNKLNYKSSGKFEWIPENKVLMEVEVYGVVWHDNKWAEIITEEPKQPEINTCELKFEAGKWYKYGEWYLKYSHTHNNIFIASEYISDDKRYASNLNNFTCGFAASDKVLITDLSEIQEYLPEGHPDKIKIDSEYIVGKWYKMGEWVAKFSELKEGKFWCSMSGTPHDNYKHFGFGNLSIKRHGIPKLITDMTEVYKLFPEEKPKESEFEVNDWVVVEKWHYEKIPLPQTCQISRIDSGDEVPYEILLNKDPYGNNRPWYFKKGEFRHATSEEVDREIERRQLIKSESPKITQIVKSDLELEIISPKINMLLSIDDEELPMINIIKIKTIKQLLNND